MKIRDMSISARAKSCLLRAGYTDSTEIEDLSDDDLLAIKDMNKTCIDEIHKTLSIKENAKPIINETKSAAVLFAERLNRDLEKIKSMAQTEHKVHDMLKDKSTDLQYISNLRIKDILPDGYEEVLQSSPLDFDSLSVREYNLYIRSSKNVTVSSLKIIENEKIDTFLPWLYLDGPFTFELGGRIKREMMRKLVEELLVIYGVSTEIIELIKKRRVL